MIDLFDGKLSLSDALNTDLSLLFQLRDAKLEIKEELQKAQDEANGKSYIKMSDPSEIKQKLKEINNAK